MRDQVGAPIFYPEVYSPNISDIEQKAVDVLEQRFGASHASFVMGRVKSLFNTTTKPVIVCSMDGVGGYTLAIFSGKGCEELQVPPPPSYLTSQEIQDCLISLISIVEDQIDGVVDWEVCQILCGFRPQE